MLLTKKLSQAQTSSQSRFQEDGYTLVELVAVMTIVSILNISVASIYLFSMSWIERWKERSALERSALLLMMQFTKDMRYARALTFSGDSLWVIDAKNEDKIRYEQKDTLMLRNGILAHDPRLSLRQFWVSSNQFKDRVTILSNGRHIDQIWDVGIILQSRYTNIELHTAVNMRQPNLWPMYISSIRSSGLSK